MNSNDRWKKENTMVIQIRLNRNTDDELITWIEYLKENKISVAGRIREELMHCKAQGRFVGDE